MISFSAFLTEASVARALQGALNRVGSEIAIDNLDQVGRDLPPIKLESPQLI